MSLFFTKSRGASERPIFFTVPEPPCAVPEPVALELCSLGLSKKGIPRLCFDMLSTRIPLAVPELVEGRTAPQ